MLIVQPKSLPGGGRALGTTQDIAIHFILFTLSSNFIYNLCNIVSEDSINLIVVEGEKAVTGSLVLL